MCSTSACRSSPLVRGPTGDSVWAAATMAYTGTSTCSVHSCWRQLCSYFTRAALQGSATLSMAYAAALFGDACLRGLNGATATECTYVDSNVDPNLPFLATKVKLGTEGK
eukprot:GHUV01023573.1.p1 GENE.GHUV01023573.1~~GHUV01023573.1.p1  ORF type:complete len:110 (-),score=16.85 GHUV01023573.1:1147-1476(-)